MSQGSGSSGFKPGWKREAGGEIEARSNNFVCINRTATNETSNTSSQGSSAANSIRGGWKRNADANAEPEPGINNWVCYSILIDEIADIRSGCHCIDSPLP
jgi:hypothetical protein